MSVTDLLAPLDAALYPLSSAQQGIWLGQLLAPEQPSYSIGCVIRFEGTIHRDAWEHAIATVIARHDALRTVLVEEAPLPRQRVLESLPFSLPWHDYSAHADGEQSIWDHLHQAIAKPFALYGQPLWDIQWLQASAERGYCLYRCHHLIADGISLGMLCRQVVESYNQLLRGQHDQTAAPSYLQALAADQAYLDSTRYRRDQAYWRAYLHTRPAPLFPSTTTALGHQPSVQLTSTLDTPDFLVLSTLAERLGGSLASMIVACLATCLARLSHHQGPVALGLAVHNRHNASERAMFGMLSAQLPLYLDISPHADIATAMRVIATALRTTMRHARFPLQHAVRQLGASAQQTPRPFDIGVSIEDFSVFSDADIVEGIWQTLPLHAGYEDTALSVFVRRYSTRHPALLEFNVNPDRLPLALAESAMAALRQMLRGLLEAPHSPLSQLPLLCAEERSRLDDCNGREVALAERPYLHHEIERQVQCTPQAIAIVDGKIELSYAELDARANQLAHHLIALGVGPDIRVAVCLPRGSDLVVSLLAVLKAGGAYLPLDPRYPPARLAFMLEDSEPRCLLTHAALAEQLPHSAYPCVALDASTAWTMHPTHRPNPGARGLLPHHLAYVIYTSGSTGRAKGVMVSHHALMQFLTVLQSQLTLSPEDSLLAVTTVCFDIAGLELFAPLLHGARVVMAGDQAIRQPSDWLRLLQQHAISVLQATPAFWQMLLDAGWQSHPQLRMLCGGEALTRQLAQRLRAGGGQLWNLYGPTEATIWTSTYHVRGEEAVSVVPLGRPLPNTRLHVLDRYRQRVPFGVIGELCIAGPQLARGYLGRADLTAERFVPDPFAAQPGQRMYRTGDMARWRDDGALEYLGRNDEQIKLRGVRIELGEIAAALRACDGVREAVVIARSDSGEQRLVAYLVGETVPSGDATRPDANVLRTRLAACLPEVMLPSAYVWLATLPLTANGKLDRHALPAPDASALATQAYVAPQGEAETCLAMLWCELLGVGQVGRHDNFFALGGHSLLAVQLIARLRVCRGIDLALSTLFAHPRLTDLAVALAHAPANALPAIVPVPHPDPLPLSFAQQRLWVLAQFDPRANLAYLMPGVVALRGALNLTALRQALDRLLARHDALRTHFVATDAGPAQVIAPSNIAMPLECIDLRHSADPQAAAQRYAEQETSTAFELEHGPLLRARLLQLAEDNHLLLVTLHHLIADGWSIGVLLRELGALYSAFVHGQHDPLPPLPIQYPDYTLWQRRWIDGPLLQQQRQFWCEHLRDAPALLTLPTDRPRPPEQDYAGDAIPVAFDAPHTQALIALSQRQGTTLFMTLLAAWGALLARLAGQNQVVIGTPIAQRTRGELEPLIGLFVNTQALHIDLRADPSVADLLTQVRATALAAQAHQDLPFEQVIEALNPVRSLAHAPLFQAMFTWQNTPQVALALPDLHCQLLPAATREAKYDLELDLRLEHGCILGSLRFATALFDPATLQRQWDNLGVLLDGMLADDHARVGKLPLLSPAQRQHLHTFTGHDAPAAEPRSLPQWFAQQVAATPHAIALFCADTALSYQQLDRQANRLAHHLIALGAQPERCVALCLQRGIAQILAVLAVLKSGAAYLPLDPSQPRERITTVLDDAQPVLVLVDDPEHLVAPTALTPPIIAIAAAQAAAADAPEHAPVLPPLSAQHLAYVIYTSGSTGKPKGVLVSHHALTTRLHALIDLYRLAPQDRILQFAALA
ncbi:non-ribosomal peptide synthetase, partial [Xanthomonas albilineans]|uniref:non-ribosomal peptide synthetase n=1 Tax=Xanthomonas albilineans TaxID=29447 RepID=UPI0018B0C73D